jgi:hypothetical protein
MMNHPARIVAVALLIACAGALAQPAAVDPREAATVRIMEASGIDRLILANARAAVADDPKTAQRLDDLMYGLRPPALWNARHPAWAPARKALTELVGRESNAWVQQYWRESALKTHVRELAGLVSRRFHHRRARLRRVPPPAWLTSAAASPRRA